MHLYMYLYIHVYRSRSAPSTTTHGQRNRRNEGPDGGGTDKSIHICAYIGTDQGHPMDEDDYEEDQTDQQVHIYVY